MATKKGMKEIRINLTPEDYDKLLAYAKECGVTRTYIARSMIHEALQLVILKQQGYIDIK